MQKDDIERRAHLKDLERRVCCLEDDMKIMGEDIKVIMRNHLPHINSKIAVLIAQMVIVMGGMAYLIFG